MKKCPKCGAEFADDVMYCTLCGAPLVNATIIDKIEDAAEEVADGIKADAEELADKIKDATADEREDLKEKKDDLKEKAADVADDIKEAAAKLGAAAKEAADKLNDKYGDKAREGFDKAKDGFEKVMDTPDSTSTFTTDDIENNKVIALFSYLGILFIVPLIAGKDSPFCRFHANQGIVLFLTAIVCNVFAFIPGIRWVAVVLRILCTALAILGIINAVTGKAKELPVIGKFKVIK